MDEGRPCLLCQDNLAVGIKLENEVIENSKELLEKLVVWYNIDPCILEKKSCICEPCLAHVLNISATLRRWTAAQAKIVPSETSEIKIKEEDPLEIDGWENIELMPEQTLTVPSECDTKKDLLPIVEKEAATEKPSNDNFAIAVRSDGLILAKFYRNGATATRTICTCCNAELSLMSLIRPHSFAHRSDPRYICRRCGKTFNSSTKLKHHEQTERHTHIWTRLKGFDFRCVECGKNYDRIHAVVRHASLAHVPNNFSCTFSKCSCTFDNQTDLKKHFKTHELPVYHADPLYMCHFPDCGQSYYLESHFNKHMKTFHGMYVCPEPECGKTVSLTSQVQHAKLHYKDRNGKSPPKQGEFLPIEHSVQRKRRFSYSPPNDDNRGQFISLPKQLTLK